jgi:polyphosphate glucokinase
MQMLGIDIGGSRIKAGIVDTLTGTVVSKFSDVPTPKPSTPQALLKHIQTVITHFNYKGVIGCGFPGVIREGVVHTAANLDSSWIHYPFSEALFQATGCVNFILNDADAAGIAENALGAAKGFKRSWIMVTLGTGLGTALFYKGQLFPNAELGHLIMNGKHAETLASAAVFKTNNLTWKVWGERLSEYLQYLECLLWPELIVFGGSVVKNWLQLRPYLKTRCELKPAFFLNQAGVVGAALATIAS